MNRPYLSQLRFNIAGNVNFFCRRVFFCSRDREPVPVNPDDALEFADECLGKKAGPAKRVDE